MGNVCEVLVRPDEAVVLAGHSRGAKLAALAAQQAAGLVLVDPVDASDFAPIDPPRFPSALSALNATPPPWRAAAVVYAANAGACAPATVDGAAFADALARRDGAKLLCVRSEDATHFGCLDEETFTQAAACPGPASEPGTRLYRSATRAAATAVCYSACASGAGVGALRSAAASLTEIDAAAASADAQPKASGRYAPRWNGGNRLTVSLTV